MNKLEKFNLHLTQLILKTKNIKNDMSNVVIGNQHENITFKNNSPLNININSNKESIIFQNTRIGGNTNYKTQYIHRVSNTPYYVSYLSNENYILKIVDFYDWILSTKIYRIFIIKKNNSSISKTEFIIDNKFQNETIEKDISDNVKFNFTEKSSTNNTNSIINLTIDTGIYGIGMFIDFESDSISSITLNTIINNFYKLYDICNSNHVNNVFITKNDYAERELDELWNQQKYVQPDFSIRSKENINRSKYHDFWISDFLNYFNIDKDQNKPSLNVKEHKLLPDPGLGLFEFLPKTYELLKYYCDSNIYSIEIVKKIQQWWDIFSLPLFRKIFIDKCKYEPDEVFVVLFFSIRFSLPWSKILHEEIVNVLSMSSLTHSQKFLYFLTYIFKRIIKIKNLNGIVSFNPGYFWDNNYKSIREHDKNIYYSLTRYSTNYFSELTISENRNLKINKICILNIDKKNRKIWIQPQYNRAFDFTVPFKELSLQLEEWSIVVPLVWNECQIEFKSFKIKWLLKKTRFQFTIYSTKSSKILLNKIPLNLEESKKTKFYIEVIKDQIDIKLSLYNRNGATKFSGIEKNKIPIIISGNGITEDGLFTKNILYNINKRKYKIFPNYVLDSDSSLIYLNEKKQSINFSIKHFSKSIPITYYKNEFIDKFFNLRNTSKLILIIDLNFKEDTHFILKYFDVNFGILPEYFISSNYKKQKFNSNLIIKFLFSIKKENSEVDFIVEKYYIEFFGKEISNLLLKFNQIIKENIQNDL